jgi:23S rRNA pseudouridine2605 synthase
MPPRHAYWTILVDDQPTAFRAHDPEELLPTLNRLKEKNASAVMRWFERGKLWDSRDAARDAGLGKGERRWEGPRPDRDDQRVGAPDDADAQRDRDWRPGGQHRDPRQKYKDAKKAKWQRFKQNLRARHEHRLANDPESFSPPHGDPLRGQIEESSDRPAPDEDRDGAPTRPHGDALTRRRHPQPRRDRDERDPATVADGRGGARRNQDVRFDRDRDDREREPRGEFRERRRDFDHRPRDGGDFRDPSRNERDERRGGSRERRDEGRTPRDQDRGGYRGGARADRPRTAKPEWNDRSRPGGEFRDRRGPEDRRRDDRRDFRNDRPSGDRPPSRDRRPWGGKPASRDGWRDDRASGRPEDRRHGERPRGDRTSRPGYSKPLGGAKKPWSAKPPGAGGARKPWGSKPGSKRPWGTSPASRPSGRPRNGDTRDTRGARGDARSRGPRQRRTKREDEE